MCDNSIFDYITIDPIGCHVECQIHLPIQTKEVLQVFKTVLVITATIYYCVNLRPSIRL